MSVGRSITISSAQFVEDGVPVNRDEVTISDRNTGCATSERVRLDYGFLGGDRQEHERVPRLVPFPRPREGGHPLLTARLGYRLMSSAWAARERRDATSKALTDAEPASRLFARHTSTHKGVICNQMVEKLSGPGGPTGCSCEAMQHGANIATQTLDRERSVSELGGVSDQPHRRPEARRGARRRRPRLEAPERTRTTRARRGLTNFAAPTNFSMSSKRCGRPASNSGEVLDEATGKGRRMTVWSVDKNARCHDDGHHCGVQGFRSPTCGNCGPTRACSSGGGGRQDSRPPSSITTSRREARSRTS